MRELKYNEEYAIKFIFSGSRYVTPIGRGFSIFHLAEKEVQRLFSKGISNAEIFIRRWS